MAKTEKENNKCSFCLNHKDDVKKLIVSDNVAICDACVEMCHDLILKDLQESKNPDEKVLDLVYVKDIINAILKVTEEWDNEVYNVSTEEGVTITDLIKTISETLDVTLEIETKPENRTDIEKKRVGSVSRLKGLGWEPQYDLSKGIKETYQWISSLNGQN